MINDPLPAEGAPDIGALSFEDALAECLDAVESGQATAAEAVARFPHFPELEDLVSLAQAIGDLPAPAFSQSAVANGLFTKQAGPELHDDPDSDVEDEALALALDECLALIQRGEASPAEAAARYPEHSEMGELLLLAQALRELPQPERDTLAPPVLALSTETAPERGDPPPVDAGRSHLSLLPSPSRVAHLASRPVIRAAMAVVPLMLAWSAIAPAAQASVPGEPLYPIKRLWEQVELAVTVDDVARAQVRLGLVERRMKEASNGSVDVRVREGLLAEAVSEVQYLRSAATRLPDALSIEVTTRAEELRSRGADPESAPPLRREPRTVVPRQVPTAAAPVEEAAPAGAASSPGEVTAQRSVVAPALVRAVPPVSLPAAPAQPLPKQDKGPEQPPEPRDRRGDGAGDAVRVSATTDETPKDAFAGAKDQPRDKQDNAKDDQAGSTPWQTTPEPTRTTAAVPTQSSVGRGPGPRAVASTVRRPTAAPMLVQPDSEDREDDGPAHGIPPSAHAAEPGASPTNEDTSAQQSASALQEDRREGHQDDKTEAGATPAPTPQPKPQENKDDRAEASPTKTGAASGGNNDNRPKSGADNATERARTTQPAGASAPGAGVAPSAAGGSDKKDDGKSREKSSSVSTPAQSTTPSTEDKKDKAQSPSTKQDTTPRNEGAAKLAESKSSEPRTDSSKTNTPAKEGNTSTDEKRSSENKQSKDESSSKNDQKDDKSKSNATPSSSSTSDKKSPSPSNR